jgi:hypothetical protein
MMKRAKLVLVFILLLGGVFLLACYQVEAGDLANAKTAYLGENGRIKVVIDATGQLDYVCFSCIAYNIPDCSAVPLGEYCCDSGTECENDWRQGQLTNLDLCRGFTNSSGELDSVNPCLNINNAYTLITGFGTENWPSWPPYR